MLSFKSFSQNDTVSTTIQLSKPVAKLVVTDLISGDQAKLEVKTLNELIAELEKKNTTSLDITLDEEDEKDEIPSYDAI